MIINYWLDENGYEPSRAHKEDAGFDIKCPSEFIIPPLGEITVYTKLHMSIPAGYVGFIKSKSGLNVKHGLRCEGVIDAGYTGV